MTQEEFKLEIEKLVEFCIDWKGESPQYELSLKKETVQEILEAVSDWVDEIIPTKKDAPEVIEEDSFTKGLYSGYLSCIVDIRNRKNQTLKRQ